MKISIVAAGNKMPAWVVGCCEDYLKRLSRTYKINLLEVPLEKRGKAHSIESLRHRETVRLLEAVPSNDWLVTLDSRGATKTTSDFSEDLQRWQQLGKNVSFLIGGPDGIDFLVADPRRPSWPDQKLSLSALTFPHPLVRVILAEQLYRASSLLAGHPYHRE